MGRVKGESVGRGCGGGRERERERDGDIERGRERGEGPEGGEGWRRMVFLFLDNQSR